MTTTYSDLRKINVNAHIQKKGQLNYLSWAWAADTLLQHDQSATWTYSEPKMFGDTMMVFCTVNAFGKSMTAQLPVMDYKNKAIVNPCAMAVNTAMQRCLAKAIGLHGIGLYIYAGEDAPSVVVDLQAILTELGKSKTIEQLATAYHKAINDCHGNTDAQVAVKKRATEIKSLFGDK